jgi:hypothetical protein
VAFFSGRKVINARELSAWRPVNICNPDAEKEKFHRNKMMKGICGFGKQSAII